MEEMKMNKKRLITIIFIIIATLLILSGIFILIQEREIRYSCYQRAGESPTVILENIYEFSYKKKDIKDVKKSLVITYKDKEEFKEAYYDEYFKNEGNPPIDIKIDNKELKRTYIWNEGLHLNKDNPTLENYIEVLEKVGYSCEKK